jgi:thiol-disulfide isomerase/thioredoxin
VKASSNIEEKRSESLKTILRDPAIALLAALLLTASLPSCAQEKKGAASTSGSGSAGPSAAPAAQARPVADILRSLRITPLQGRAAVPDIDLAPLKGAAQKLSGYAGKALILNFWATWCPPCRAEMPSMQRLRDALLKEGVPFEILAVDVQEDAKTVRDFISGNRYSFPVFLDEAGALSSRFVGQGIPTSYVIDKKGKAVGFVVGSIEWDGDSALELFRLLGSE